VAPTVTALVLYALLPIVRNTIVGLDGVDPAVSEAARGIGMNRLEVLARVELPLAWPAVLTGMRVSTQMLMGIAAIAAYAKGPGLGNVIFSGLSRVGSANAVNMALAGTLGVVVLALVLDGLFVLVGRLTTSRGIRG
jgi:osmoprotectant transport system permease protein